MGNFLFLHGTENCEKYESSTTSYETLFCTFSIQNSYKKDKSELATVNSEENFKLVSIKSIQNKISNKVDKFYEINNNEVDNHTNNQHEPNSPLPTKLSASAKSPIRKKTVLKESLIFSPALVRSTQVSSQSNIPMVIPFSGNYNEEFDNTNAIDNILDHCGNHDDELAAKTFDDESVNSYELQHAEPIGSPRHLIVTPQNKKSSVSSMPLVEVINENIAHGKFYIDCISKTHSPSSKINDTVNEVLQLLYPSGSIQTNELSNQNKSQAEASENKSPIYNIWKYIVLFIVFTLFIYICIGIMLLTYPIFLNSFIFQQPSLRGTQIFTQILSSEALAATTTAVNEESICHRTIGEIFFIF